jgi:hypothetical protein
MIPEVGSTCLFTFSIRFSTLNGAYRIRAQTTFQDALTSGINFVNHLYIPAGLSQADFDADYRQYISDGIAVLESVKDNNVIYYVPESLFLTIPDPTIKEYLPLILVAELGVFENTQVIYPVLDQINDLMQSGLGVANGLRILTNPQNKAYLTQSQYQIIQDARDANIKTLVPLSVQVKTLQEEKAYLATLCAEYEAVIARLSTAQPPAP